MASEDSQILAPAPPAADRWRAWLRELSPRALVWVIAAALAAALLLNPIFMVSFAELVGRTVFVALVCLLAFTGAGHLHRRARRPRVPRWVVQSIALALAAPLATAAVYLVATGGDFVEFVRNQHRVTGFVFIAGTAIMAGLLLAMGSMLRERDAQARAGEDRAGERCGHGSGPRGSRRIPASHPSPTMPGSGRRTVAPT